MERVEFFGKSCWIENPDAVPISFDHIRNCLGLAELVGSVKSYTLRFQSPGGWNRSVGCIMTAVTDTGTIRFAAGMGALWVAVFQEVLSQFVRLSVVAAREPVREKKTA